MSKAPIKKCDYCENTGVMPTFRDGETICRECEEFVGLDDMQRPAVIKLKRENERLRGENKTELRRLADKYPHKVSDLVRYHELMAIECVDNAKDSAQRIMGISLSTAKVLDNISKIKADAVQEFLQEYAPLLDPMNENDALDYPAEHAIELDRKRLHECASKLNEAKEDQANDK